MRQGTYRIAYDEAVAELEAIVEQFEELRLRKEQIETVVEALKPFVGLDGGISAAELEAAFAKSEAAVQLASEAVNHTFSEVAAAPAETIQVVPEVTVEPVPVAVGAEATEPAAYFRQPSSDPFQRRIDDALWGWQQRPEGLLSPI
jgi:hypothetical protein